MTIWWTSGYHCLTCGIFSLKGCKDHRAGNIPAKAIIEATLDDIKILSDGMAEMIVAELKGEARDRPKALDEDVAPITEEPADLLPSANGEEIEGTTIEEQQEVPDVPEHFLVSQRKNEFRCSCGRRFETEHVFLSHVELESQLQ